MVLYPIKIHRDNRLRRSGRARSVLVVTEANQRRTNHVAMAALTSYRPWLSAREKIIENGSLQLEICYPAGLPDRALGGVKI